MDTYNSVFWKEGKKGYKWDTYNWCNGSETTITKYCTSSSCGKVDNKYVLEAADDAATANWGGSWRMPTKKEWRELINNCYCSEAEINGVKGYKFTKGNNFIFLPKPGYHEGTYLYQEGSTGHYWTATQNEDGPYIYGMAGYYGDKFYHMSRFCGCSVRAVCP